MSLKEQLNQTEECLRAMLWVVNETRHGRCDEEDFWLEIDSQVERMGDIAVSSSDDDTDDDEDDDDGVDMAMADDDGDSDAFDDFEPEDDDELH